MWTLCVYLISVESTDAARILLRKEFLGKAKICRSRDFLKCPQREILTEDKGESGGHTDGSLGERDHLLRCSAK